MRHPRAHRCRALVGALLTALALCRAPAAAEPEGWRTVADVTDFARDTAGWTVTNWERAGRAYATGNEARADDDGALRLYLRPYDGKNSYSGYHGNAVSRPLPLYGGFDVACDLRWDRKFKYTLMQAWLTLSGPDGGATVELNNARLNAWPGKAEAVDALPDLPLAGEARVRFVRQDGRLRILWNDTPLAESDWDKPVREIRLTVRTFKTNQKPGTFIGLARLRVVAEAAGLPVADAPVSDAAPSALPGGDFQARADDGGGILDAVTIRNDNLSGVGLGELKGWETPVDGRTCVWFRRDEKADDRALRLEIGGDRNGVTFASRPIRLEAGREYVLSGVARLSSDVTAAVRIDQSLTGNRRRAVAAWQGGATPGVGRPQPYRVIGAWSPLRVVFTAKDDRPCTVTLAAAPAQGAGARGSAAFDDLAIRPVTPRDTLRDELAAALDGAMAVRDQARVAGYEGEVAFDIAGFDLDEAPDSEQRRAVQAQREAFRAWTDGDARHAAEAVGSAARAHGAAATFFARVPTDALRPRIEALHASVAAWQAAEKEWRAKAVALRAAADPLRPAPAPPVPTATWLNGRFHIIWFNHYGDTSPPGEAEAIRYMGHMGATGYLNMQKRAEEWPAFVERTKREMALLQREGMRLLCEHAAHPIPHVKQMELTQENLTRFIEAFGADPAFGGFQFDEIHCGDCPCQDCADNFRRWVRAHVTPQELIDLGVIKKDIAELDGQRAPTIKVREENLPLHMLALEARADAFANSLKKARDIAHALKPDAVVFNLLSPAQVMGGPFDAPVWRLADVSDMMSLDPYWNGVPEEAYFMDLMDARMAGPAVLTVGTHYGARTARTLARDLAISFAHCQGVYIFDWPFAFKQPPYNKHSSWMGYWNPPGKWDAVAAYADEVKALEPYLLNVRSNSPVALLHSDRSTAADSYKVGVMVTHAGPYTLGQMGLYCLLQQAHVQADPHYLDRMAPETLARYRVALLHNAISLTPEEEDLLRAWVRDGGRLIATASSTLRDRWGRPRKDYALADVFGVRYVEGGELPEGATFDAGGAVACTGRFDRVEATGGTVKARFADGAPAVVEHAFGKGACVFIAAQDLGRSYTVEKRGGEVRDYFGVYKTFAPGLRDFVVRTVGDAVRGAGAELPFAARGCPDAVEVAVRVQQEKGGAPRTVIHLLNYGLDEPVHGVEIALPRPAADATRAVYPVDGAPANVAREGDRLVLRVRNFAVHECIVLER